MNTIVCHYGELALKGRNRKWFEKILLANITNALKPVGNFFLPRLAPGRIFIDITRPIHPEELQKAYEYLSRVFGIVNFSFAEKIEAQSDLMKEAAFALLQKKTFTTFKIEARRSGTALTATSPQINAAVGEYVLSKLRECGKNALVKLKNPDATCHIEILGSKAFLYTEKRKGAGGLPLGVSGRGVVLLSGGIDSPVAAHAMMQRGMETVLVHFHSYPATSSLSIEKVKEIAGILRRWQPGAKLLLIPFSNAQKEIVLNAPQSLRVLLYRRFMFSIAERLSLKLSAKALITGECMGQVASQTVENMGVIQAGLTLPVLRPLIAADKEEIIRRAKAIGTFEASTSPGEDCCSLFLPPHPETKARLYQILQAEKGLEKEQIITEALNGVESYY